MSTTQSSEVAVDEVVQAGAGDSSVSPRQPILGDPNVFQRRLTISTLSILLIVLLIHLLQQFATILQPLFIAAFLLYLILPAHRWLVRQGLRPAFAYALILILVLGGFYGVGRLVYSSAEEFGEKWPQYEERLNRLLYDVQKSLPFLPLPREPMSVRDLFQFKTQDLLGPLTSLAGSFLGFFAGLAVVAIYLLFLVAEKLTFPERLQRALGTTRASQVLDVAESVNVAIGNYLGVKALSNLIAAVLTVVFLAVAGVPFVATWGIVTFLLLFIPYVGSVLVIAAQVLLALLELPDSLVVVLILALMLGAVHNILGSYVEPKLMGKSLGVSPLLILLSLTFWGIVWGIVGMILAVPLIVVIKIVLENIPETRPIATLMSSE